MPTYEDHFIGSMAASHPVAELEDCAIAVDATYYLQLLLGPQTCIEPLLPALGGLTGMQRRIEEDLAQWEKHRVIPFFVFDGISLVGQDEVTVQRGLQAVEKTDYAWELYFGGQANEAVAAFGQNTNAFRVQTLYPLLQSVLKARGLHFLVAPFNAAAQIAYFDLVDSDQCAGIMGSLELMLYPIRDSVIRSIDWDTGSAVAVSKQHVIKLLNVSESLFVDALLLTGTSFLPTFPPLQDPTIVKGQPYSVLDAANMLRTSEKSVTFVCNTFSDVLKATEPQWLDKYRKARMAVNHFIFIAENGEVKVHDFEHLTNDNYEYLGYALPAELFHYLNVGLIHPRLLTWVVHGELQVLPTPDGYVSEEYKKLVQSQTRKVKEKALTLLVPRLHRGISFKDIRMRVWYDRGYAETVWDHRDNRSDLRVRMGSWKVSAAAVKAHFPKFVHGSIISEVLSLKKADFRAETISATKTVGVLFQTAEVIKSICLWRFLHVREYVDDKHELTQWGTALATALEAIEPTVNRFAAASAHLYESVLVAFELIRFGLLNAKNRHEKLRGLPLNGSQEDQASLLLISRCATLLKLRHQPNGYTGPLSKNHLVFRSLVSEVRAADRDLLEAILASMFLLGQAKRKRNDNWELSHSLPFLFDPDVALGIAVKTYLDDLEPNDPKKKEKLESFPKTFVPYSEAFSEDLAIACDFFNALHEGVKAVEGKNISDEDLATWTKASKYLAVRR